MARGRWKDGRWCIRREESGRLLECGKKYIGIGKVW